MSETASPRRAIQENLNKENSMASDDLFDSQLETPVSAPVDPPRITVKDYDRSKAEQIALPGLEHYEPKPKKAKPKRSLFMRILTWFFTVVLVGVLGLGIAVGLLPAMHGGKPLTILTGSMRPTLNPGDLAIVYGVDSFDQVKVGDIVTFMPIPDDPTLVTHRLIGWTADADGTKMAITQGDANSAADEPIYEKQLRALYQYRIPKLGYVLQWGADEFSKPRVLLIAAAILIGYSIIILITTSFRPKTPSSPSPSRARI